MKTFNQFILENNLEKYAQQAKIDISKFNKNELLMGMQVEKEHGSIDSDTNVTSDDPVKTLKIVIAHLREDPRYYTKLKKVEL